MANAALDVDVATREEKYTEPVQPPTEKSAFFFAADSKSQGQGSSAPVALSHATEPERTCVGVLDEELDIARRL